MRQTVLLVLTILLPLAANAGANTGDVWTLPLFTSDPQQVLAAARQTTVPRDAAAYVIDQNFVLHLDEQGKAHWLQRHVVRVVDDRGVRMFGTWVVPWVSWRQERPRIRARVITRDGQAHELDASTIVEGGVSHGDGSQLLSDTRAISAALPAVQADCVIEVEIETNDKGTLVPGGQFLRYTLTQAVPVLHYHITVEGPPNRPFQAVAEALDHSQRTEERTDDVSRVIYEGRDLPAPKPRGMLSPEQRVFPAVVVSTGVTWRTLASWYNYVVDERAGPVQGDRTLAPPGAAKRIGEILAEINSSVRYTGLELGSAAFMPRSAAETLRRGFGDCKDKAVLLANRLRKEGIPAYLALLTPYPIPDVNPDVPGIETFTHAIVYVPAQPQAIWVDATAEFTPVPRLPFADQGRWALVAQQGVTHLIRTPESKAEDNITRYNLTIKLQAESDSIYDLKEEVSGAFEELARRMTAMNPERVREERGQGLKRNINVDFENPRDLNSPYHMSVTGEGYDAARTDDKTAFVDISPLGIDAGFLVGIAQDQSLLRDSDAAARTQDYCLPVLFTEEMDKHIIPPPGYKLRWPPAMPWQNVGPLTLARSVKVQTDGSIILSYRLVSSKRCYSVTEARAIAQEIHKLSTSRDATVRVEFFKE